MDAIKRYMLTHGLKPGDPLPTEAVLCADLGVSRSSVREALRKLEALDIITVHQGRGSFVGQMSMQPLVDTLVLRSALDQINGIKSLSEVIRIRRSLDLGIAEELVAAMRGTTNPHLWDAVDAMKEKALRGATYYDEDIAFHSGLLDYLDNSLMQQLTSAMWLIHQTASPGLKAADGEQMMAAALAHGDILSACEHGDVDAYKAAVDWHYGPLNALIDGD
ncbi:GntR family transcriptional regulator [Actinomyces sp. B33]|uniref:FadR/GntR family transcriptional regulator n=1 Tax=Actinomyces sp. B33 TaxID=2942131 RepID=UPI0023425364|nr:GntR family transcriptional regulator [Actinomyces sp. B33]MDC4233568.1 GntR family transcriptional regulator [Actinomyces sp. B33]